jgi:hypothetical protein
MGDCVSDMSKQLARDDHTKMMRLSEAVLLAGMSLATMVLTTLSVLAVYSAGIAGVALALVILLLVGLAVLVAAGLDSWLPALFGLSLMASLNFTIESVPLTLYAFDPFLVALYVAWFWRAYRGGTPKLRLTMPDGLSLAFLSWLLVASLVGRHVPTSLNGWLLYARGILIFFYFAHAVQGPQVMRVLVAVLMAMTALQGGLGVAQYLTRSNIGSISDLVGGSVGSVRQVETGSGVLFRVRGTLNTDTSLAHWLEMLVPLSLSLWLASKGRWRRLVLGAIVLAGVAAQVVTFTRGGWIGVAAGVVLVLWLQFRSRVVARRQLVAAVMAVIMLGLLLVPFAGLIRARLFESEQNTIAVRENLNRTALEVIRDHPITGIGLDNFVRVAPDYGTGWRWLMEGKSHKVHNVYLALASEAGPLGLLLFITLMTAVLVSSWRRSTGVAQDGAAQTATLARGLVGGLAAVLVHGLAAWGLLSYGVFPLFWMLVGLATQTSTHWEEEGSWPG